MKRWLLILVSALLVFSLACGVLDRVREVGEEIENLEIPEIDETPAAPIPSEGDDVSEDEEELGETELSIDPNALEGLRSYRSRAVMRTDYDDGTVEEIVIEEAATREPRAQHMIMRGFGEGMEEEEEGIEIIQIGTRQWVKFGDAWFQSEAEDGEAPFGEDSLVSFEDFFNDGWDDDDYRYEGRATINGVATRHYTFQPDDAFSFFGMMGLDEVEEIRGEVWIADQNDLPQFPVRFIIEVLGEVEEGRGGTFTFEQEVYDVNEPFIIEPPADADSGGLPEDVPVYPQTLDMNALGGMVFFSTNDDLAAVHEFYVEGLEAEGWTRTDSMDFDTMVMETWEKGERSLQLTISVDEDTGTTDVMIVLGE